MLYFVIIQRSTSTPHDYNICTPFLSRCFLVEKFKLFTKPSNSDFLRVHQTYLTLFSFIETEIQIAEMIVLIMFVKQKKARYKYPGLFY